MVSLPLKITWFNKLTLTVKHQANSCISVLYGIMTLIIGSLLLFTAIDFFTRWQ